MVSPAVTRYPHQPSWSPPPRPTSPVAVVAPSAAGAPVRPRPGVVKAAVLALGAAVAVWLGLTAPEVSPVTPAPAPASATTVGGAATDPTGVAPVVPAAPVAPNGAGRGRGGGPR